MGHYFTLIALTFLSVSIFNSAGAQRLRTTTDLSVKRALHEAQVLPNGKVLVMGGMRLDNLVQVVVYASCEIYDPATEQWAPAASMNVARRNFASVVTQDGKVLAIGGSNSSDTPLRSVERYDPVGDTWTLVGYMDDSIQNIDAARMDDGRILVMGGSTNRLHEGSPDGSNWTMHEFQQLGFSLPEAPRLLRINNGRTLAIGASHPATGSGHLAVIVGNNFMPDTAMGRFDGDHPGAGLAMLQNGKVLIAGGNAEGESYLFDTANNTITKTGDLNTTHMRCPLMLMTDGRVAVATVGNTFQDIVLEIYNPATGQWTYQTGHNFTATDLHEVAPIGPGKYLVAGGRHYMGLANEGSVKCFIFDEFDTGSDLDEVRDGGARLFYDATSQQLRITDNFSNSIFSGSIFNVNGQAVQLITMHNAVSLPELPAGIYLALLTGKETGEQLIAKIIIQ